MAQQASTGLRLPGWSGAGCAVELVRLLDRSCVTLRAAEPRDEAALRSFLSRLSPEARRLRFFTGGADLAEAAHSAVDAHAGRYGLVAHDESGTVVGHATYIPLDAERAEVAVEVADHLHDCGLATILIERLAQVAERRGVAQFVAEVLPENHPMLDVFRHGFDATARFHEGVETVEFPTAAWRVARRRFAQVKSSAS